MTGVRTALKLVAFLCVPLAILITAALRRDPVYQGQSAAVWAEKLRTDQSLALNALQHLGSGALPALREMLDGNSPTERGRAAWAMGRLDGSTAYAAVPDLVQKMDDGNIVVQMEVLHSLSRIGITNEDIVPGLIAKLSDGKIASYAAELLLSIEQARKTQRLPAISGDEFGYDLAFARSPTPGVRICGAVKLSKLAHADDRAQTALHMLLHDKDGWVCQEAALAVTNPAAVESSFRLVVE